MNTKLPNSTPRLTTTPKLLSEPGGSSLRFSLIVICCLIFASISTNAQLAQWDPNGLGLGSDGSGGWEDGTNWLSAGVDGGWPGPSGNAVVGFGTPGSYLIVLSQNESVNTMTNKTSGYTFTGGDIFLQSGLSATSPALYVSNGVTVTFSNIVHLPGGAGGNIVLAPNSTANFAQAIVNGGGNPRLGGQGGTGVYNLTNGFSEGGTLDLYGCTVNLYGGNFSGSRVDIGRNVNGAVPCTVNQFGGSFFSTGTFQVSRGNTAQCMLNIFGGTNASGGTYILSPESGDNTTVNMSGGLLNAGSGVVGVPGVTAGSLNTLGLLTAPSTGAQSAIFNLSGGVITAKTLLFGGGGTYSTNSTCVFTMTGGQLFLDSGGIQVAGGAVSFTPVLTLAGGVIAATAPWSSSMPMTLSNGITTFQASDTNGLPFNITLSGALSGPGGIVVAGPGTVTLSGSDAYADNTTVSNSGTLAIVPNSVGSSTIGAVSVQGSAALSTQPTSIGASWNCSSLNFSANSTNDVNFGVFLPSASQAPVVVSGALHLDATDVVSIEAANIYVGTYPLIQYGSFTGTLPTTLIVPSGVVAHLANSGTAIQLVVTTSPNTAPAVSWNIGNGIWDTTTVNWKSLITGNSSTYQDGDVVDFLDDGQANPVTLTLNSTVTPLSMTGVNVTNNFVITGSGTIAGTGPVAMQGKGTLSLGTTNTYTGGTTVSSGTLGINYGGDGLLNSAIGTGPLTVNGGKLDNTSGKNVTLVTPIATTVGNFGFVGTTNLTLGTNGTGTVTLSQNAIATISANRLTVNSPIGDNGNAFGLTKQGNGALVLNGTNTFTGGVTLDAGELDINFGGDGSGNSSIGTGALTIHSGTIDNTSGALVTLDSPHTMTWSGSGIFKGTASLDLGSGGITVSQGAGFALTVSSNFLFTEGNLNGANGPGITKTGLGTWVEGGSVSGATITVNAGTVALNAAPFVNALSVGGGIVINSGGSVVISNATGVQFASGTVLTVSGGTFDINGDTQEKPGLTFNSGIIRDSGGLAVPPSIEVLSPSAPITLGSTNCVLSVPSSSNTLDIPTAFQGTGSLTTTGAGTVALGGVNTYTGTTTVGPGTLALYDGSGSSGGFITNSSAIILSATNSALDLTGNSDANGNLQTLTLYGGQTLSGFGSVTGLVATLSGSIVSPGSASKVGTLTVTGNPGSNSLSGALLLRLNRTNAQNCSTLAFASGTVTYAGTLSVSNIGPALQVGDVFHLFPSAANGFSAINLATTDSHLFSYTWQNNVAANGSITVASVQPPVGTNILFNVSSNILTLSWPTDHLGWILQSQTNNLAGTNWVNVAGSALVTSTNLTIGGTNNAVFYRMISPP